MQELTLKEQRFIELYTNSENKATFGNGTQSYIQAGYKAKNNGIARNGGSELLAKPHIKERMRELMEKAELDFSKHLNTLNSKLNKLAETGTITKEELMAIRLGLEAQGKLGKGNTQAIQINIGTSEGGYDLNQLGLFALQDLKGAIAKREQELCGQTEFRQSRADVERVLAIEEQAEPPVKPNAWIEGAEA